MSLREMKATPLSGNEGRIKLGEKLSITGAVGSAGLVTVTCANSLQAGMFVLISGVTGMTDLNNEGKGHLVIEANSTTFKVELETSQEYGNGGTAQRIIPITKWDLNVNSESGSVKTSESGGWATRFKAGVKDWDFSYSGIEWDGARQMIVQEIYEVELDVDSNNYYSGTAIFESFKTGANVDSKNGCEITGTAKGSGELILSFRDLSA